jgi:ABC-type amino acid transport substrate-binding protein
MLNVKWKAGVTIYFLLNVLAAVSKQKILVNNYEPQVFCQPHYQQHEYDGLDVRYFRDIVDIMGWNISDFQFVCVEEFDMLFTKIFDPNVFCALGGIDINKDRLALGLKFSQPYFYTGASVVVKNRPMQWPFLDIYEYDVVLTFIFINVFGASFVFKLLENRLSYKEYMWHNVSHFFINGTLVCRSWTAKMLDLLQLVVNIVVIMIFSAKVVQLYVQRNNIDKISSIADIQSSTVATWLDYYDFVYELDGKPVTYDANIPDDILTGLNSNDFDAMLYDDIFISWATLSHENLVTVGKNIFPFSFAFMFPGTTSDDLITDISMAILNINESITQDERITQFFAESIQQMYTDKDPLKITRYKLMDYYELWVLYSAAFGLAIFKTAYMIIRRRNTKEKDKKLTVLVETPKSSNDSTQFLMGFSPPPESNSTSTEKSKRLFSSSPTGLRNFRRSLRLFIKESKKQRYTIAPRRETFTRQPDSKHLSIYLRGQSTNQLYTSLVIQNRYYQADNVIGIRSTINELTTHNIMTVFENIIQDKKKKRSKLVRILTRRYQESIIKISHRDSSRHHRQTYSACKGTSSNIAISLIIPEP